MSRSRTTVALLLFTGLASGALRIEIVRGSGSNNNAVAGGTVSPVVRVLDDSGKPVSNAFVVFTAPQVGASVDFGGFGPVAQAESDRAGVASAPRAKPVVDNGPVEIVVLAEKGGQTATASIFQMNLGLRYEKTVDSLELEVIPEPDPAQNNKQWRLRVKVIDGRDSPVPNAPVTVVLRAFKSEEVGRWSGTSDANGEAVGTLSGKSGNKRLQFTIQASANGRVATRFYTPDATKP